jgi:hypothetical protein
MILYVNFWSLTLWKEHRLRAFQNRVLKTLFGPEREELTGGGKNCKMRNFILIGMIQMKEDEIGGVEI